MLILLTLFSMVAIAVFNKGIKPQGSQDPEWQKRGGDASMKTTSPLSSETTSPDLDQKKQPALRKEVVPALPANDGIRKLDK